ncbi:MAG: hypothetical protein NTW19_02440 [Planctomycetota bacterium]|nr:hypothetical protein [Planctomycetota bacterium]
MRTRLHIALAAIVMLWAGLPAWGEPGAGTLYLRFRPASVGDVYAKVVVSTAAAPWRRVAGIVPAEADRDAALRVAKLEKSDWIEVAGLGSGGTITLSFEPGPIDAMMGQVEIASSADELAVLRTLDINEPGNLVTLVIPADAAGRPAGIATVREVIGRRLKLAQRLQQAMNAPGKPRDELIGPVVTVGPPTLGASVATGAASNSTSNSAAGTAHAMTAAKVQTTATGDSADDDGNEAAANVARAPVEVAAAQPGLPLVAFAPYGLGVAYTDPRLRADELEILRLQGFSGLAAAGSSRPERIARPVPRERGWWASPFLFPAAEFVALAPGQGVARGERVDVPAMSMLDALVRLDEPASKAATAAAPAPAPGSARSPTLAFRAYLAARGLRPADFAVPSFDRVNEKPDHDKLLDATHNEDPALAQAAVNALVWTTRYRAYLASHALAAATRIDAPRDAVGRDAAVAATFVDRPIVVGAGLSPGALGPQLDAAGHEADTDDFWPDDATRDRWRRFAPRLHLGSAYLLDLLRGSAVPTGDNAAPPASPTATAFHRTPADAAAIRIDALIALGHGAKAIHFFDFGPRWTSDASAAASASESLVVRKSLASHGTPAPAATPAPASDDAADDKADNAAAPVAANGTAANPEANALARVPALDQGFATRALGMMRLSRDLARARDLIQNGQPVARQVAILHVADAELWNASWPVAQDRRLLHYALTSEQYDVDVLSDQSALARDLHAYRVIYVTDTQVPAAVLEKLRLWVKDGGWLCLGALAATQDEAGRPSAGITEFVGAEVVGRDPIDPGAAAERVTFPVRSGASVMKLPREASVSLALRACRFEKAAPDRVVANFDDGAPAAISRPLGKGVVVSLAYSPGLSLLHQLVEPGPGLAELPPAAAAAVTFPCKAAGVARAVEPSARVLSALLLMSDRGGALLLADPKPQANLTLRVAVTDVRAVESLRHGSLTFATAPGRTIITLPALDQGDIVLLHR